jgi:hypothetical protein
VSGPVAAGRTCHVRSGGGHRGHNATPEEDYRTRAERVSDSPHEGCSLSAPVTDCGNDPDAKPVRGTPRARRSADAVGSSTKKGDRARVRTRA